MVPVWIQTVGTLSQLFLSVPVYPHKFVLMTPQVFKPSFVSPVNAMPQLLCQFVVSSHNDQLIAIFPDLALSDASCYKNKKLRKQSCKTSALFQSRLGFWPAAVPEGLLCNYL